MLKGDASHAHPPIFQGLGSPGQQPRQTGAHDAGRGAQKLLCVHSGVLDLGSRLKSAPGGVYRQDGGANNNSGGRR